MKFLTLIFIFFTLSIGFANDVFIQLNGHLDQAALEKAQKQLENLENNGTLYILIKSSSGSLQDTLDFAKDIYEVKSKKKISIVTYIDEEAIGPAAILPFLSDRLYVSSFVSWGDIPSDEKTFSTNLLKSRVESLIDPENPHYSLMALLASAMIDPSLQVTDDHGWRLVGSGEKITTSLISSSNETLIVNHNQLDKLGVIEGTLSLEEFKKQFQQLYVEEKEPSVPQVQDKKGFKEHIKYNPAGPNTIGYIAVNQKDSQISQSTFVYVRKALDYYKKTQPIFIILDLNTPGGEVFAAQKISDALQEMDTQFDIPVVAVIDNWAISAGAMLAYSARFIVTVKDGSMGAAEPVIMGGEGGMQAASEKVNSAIRSDFAARASYFDRNPLIAEAMVDKDIILVYRHGKIVKLDNTDQIRLTGQNRDQVITTKNKLLTLNAEEMMKYGVADLLLLPKKLSPLTDQEKSEGKWPADTMLLFHEPFFDSIPNATIDVYQMDWKTRFFVLLATPIVASILYLGLILGFYIEFNTPGLGLPGGIALMCLFLIILSSFSLELAGWLEIILVLAGLGIILFDLFVLPTFGLLGIVGALMFVIGIFALTLPGIGSIDYEFDTGTFNAAGEAFFYRLAWLCGTLVVAFIIIVFLARFILPKFAGFRRFVLMGGEQDAHSGYVAVESRKNLPHAGAEGKVVATLRPGGKVLINDAIYDAISMTGFIEKETNILVTGYDGSTLIVEEK